MQGQTIDWSHSLNYPDGAVTNREAVKIIKLASDADEAIRKGKDVSLPLIAYYGTGRLWQEPRNAYQITDPSQVSGKEEQSRFAGYRDSIDPKLSVSQLTRWIVRQSWIAYQRQGRVPPVFEAVKQAMIGCLEGATDLSFDAVIGEVVIAMEEGPQPFSILSDGQRCILAIVGDMAQRAARLNPQYGGKTLQQTTGVVLIDELDLHLHPRWQRRIIEDLRRTFPKIQFICTTHSPFLIQAIEQGQLIQLNSPTEGIGEYANQPIEDIIEFVQGVEIPHLSQSSIELNSAAENYFSLLQDAEANPDQIEQAEAKYRQVAKRYSANPGLSAILELEALARKKREGK